MKRVYEFLKNAEVYYLATVEGDQPRVRPFGTVNEFEGKLYIQTGKVKPTSRQLEVNPKAELCAFKDGAWIRIACELVEDDRFEARKSMLDAYPNLRRMYDDSWHPGRVRSNPSNNFVVPSFMFRGSVDQARVLLLLSPSC